MSNTASVQVEQDDELSRTFEELPRITINTKDGRKEFVEAKYLNTLAARRSWIWKQSVKESFHQLKT